MHVNVYFLSAMAGVVALVWEALRTFRKSHHTNIEEIVGHAVLAFKDSIVGPIDKRLVVLETKMDLVIGGVAMNSVSVLHHPEPSRNRVDYLLDSFRDRTIGPEETEELKGYLHTIMQWEEGNAAPFVIFQGEQSAAANLLSTMDHIADPEETDGLSDPDADSTEEAGTRLPE